MKRFYRTLRIVWGITLFGVLSLASSQSNATLLNLSLDLPDFYAYFTSVGYNAGTDAFQALGYTGTYTDSGGTHDAGGGNYTLTATITGAGVLTSGSLTIEGEVSDLATGPGTLLTGSLTTGTEGTAFGSTNGGNGLFEFRFTVTGGILSNQFGGVGASNCGVIMSPEFAGEFDGTWLNSFSNDGISGFSDNAVLVPEPSTFFLLALGVALCVATHRNFKRIRVP